MCSDLAHSAKCVFSIEISCSALPSFASLALASHEIAAHKTQAQPGSSRRHSACRGMFECALAGGSETLCPVFSEARDARSADDRGQTEEAVARLLGVMPEEFQDEIALWYYPVGGPVGGLDTSGNTAMEAGELLDDLYAANC